MDNRPQGKAEATLADSSLARNLGRQPYATGLVLLSKESQTRPNLFIAPLLPPFPCPTTVLLGTILRFQAQGLPLSTRWVGSPTPRQAGIGRTWCPTLRTLPASIVPSPAGRGILPVAGHILLGRTSNPLVMGFFWLYVHGLLGPLRKWQFLGVTGTFVGIVFPSLEVPPFRLSPGASVGPGCIQDSFLRLAQPLLIWPSPWNLLARILGSHRQRS